MTNICVLSVCSSFRFTQARFAGRYYRAVKLH